MLKTDEFGHLIGLQRLSKTCLAAQTILPRGVSRVSQPRDASGGFKRKPLLVGPRTEKPPGGGLPRALAQTRTARTARF